MNQPPVSVILDLGTNTFHLLVVRKTNEGFETLHKVQIPVKLGEGGINKGFISEQAYARGIHALQQFAEVLKPYEVKSLNAFATSAIRDASNGADFIQEVKDKTGIEVGTITGDEEAMYICEGVRQSFPFTDEPFLVMDIGGGSVEFSIANLDTIFWKYSYRLGAARLIEQYHREDPMGEHERVRLYDYLHQSLSDLFEQLRHFHVATLVGAAGSFESLAELLPELLKKESKTVSPHSREIDLGDYVQLHRLLLASTTQQRLSMKSLADFRVEMMVAASCLIDVVLQNSSINRMVVSEYSLKEGMVYTLLRD